VTEAEAIESLTNIGEVAATYGGLWLSSTFAYLTVCYLVGKTLTKFECFLISGLYGTSALMFAGASIGYSNTWFLLRAREETIMDGVWLFNGMENYIAGSAVVLFGGTIISLYFMYNIRNRKSE
jgi:hypothetical protein